MRLQISSLFVGRLFVSLLMVFARPLAKISCAGIRTSRATLDTLIHLISIILTAQSFYVVGGLLSAAFQARDRHLLPALAPLVYSACIIGGGLIGATCPAWALMALRGAYCLVRFLVHSGYRSLVAFTAIFDWYPILSLRNTDLHDYLWLSFPIMIGFSIVVVDEWIVKNQASYLAPGALSYLQYGRTLIKVPIGVFGMAAGVASYPTISRLIVAGSIVEAYGVLVPRYTPDAFRHLCCSGLPDFGGFRGGLFDLGFYVAPV